MTTVLRDFRIGARRLLRAPGFTLAALTTLALGIGANTAVYSVVRHVLLAPLPYYPAWIAVACAVLYAATQPLGAWAERYAGRKDPGIFVVDEVIGYLITVAWTGGPSPLALVVAGCTAIPTPEAPPPAPRPVAPAPTAPAPLPTPAAGWEDRAIEAGAWRYDAGNRTATFVPAGGANALLSMTCSGGGIRMTSALEGNVSLRTSAGSTGSQSRTRIRPTHHQLRSNLKENMTTPIIHAVVNHGISPARKPPSRPGNAKDPEGWYSRSTGALDTATSPAAATKSIVRV